MNDNAPKFELPDYQSHNIDEDIPLGSSILKVKAMDADSGKNAEIEYLVSGNHYIRRIKIRKLIEIYNNIN